VHREMLPKFEQIETLLNLRVKFNCFGFQSGSGCESHAASGSQGKNFP
jgi:hypothetical protein